MTLDLLGLFGAGALTFLSPCVLPLIPLYLSALIGGDLASLGKRRGALVTRAAFFSAGFISVFTALGLSASALGGFLSGHKAEITAFGAVIILFFALKFLHVIEVPWMDRTLRADDRRLTTRFAWLNALGMGVVFAAGWAPCIGPALGAVLTYTASAAADSLSGAAFLATYGAGIALPLLLLSVFAEATGRLMGRLSPHLRKIEVALGGLLLLLAASLAWQALDRGAPAPDAQGAAATPLAGEPGEPALIMFSSRDCAICQRMRPVVEELSSQCAQHQVAVRILDVADPSNHALVDRHRLFGVPTFLFLDDRGREVARLIGEQPESTLRQALSGLFGKPCEGVEPLPERPAPAPLQCPTQGAAAC